MVAEMLLEIENLGLINKANLDIGKVNLLQVSFYFHF